MNSSTIGPLGDSYLDDQVQGIGLARNQGSPPFQKVSPKFRLSTNRYLSQLELKFNIESTKKAKQFHEFESVVRRSWSTERA